MEIKNAIITHAEFHIMESGILTVSVSLDYGDGGQSFGNCALYLPESFKHYKKETLAGHYLYRCMEIADVTKWSEIVGKPIRVKATHEKIYSIGHFIKDDWFDLDLEEDKVCVESSSRFNADFTILPIPLR